MSKRSSFYSTIRNICIFHMIAFVLCIIAVSVTQLGLLPSPLNQSDEIFWISISIFGLVGSFLYFSRQCYVYHITDKFERIREDTEDEEMLSARLNGYYLYLLSRPFAGIAIGPIAAMVVMGGISTISRQSTGAGPQSISDVGVYVIYLAAFIGGYTSSDLFDGLASFGKNALRPKD